MELGAKLRTVSGGRLAFWCPGCRMAHHVTIQSTLHPNWEFNNDPEKPTFTPSVLVKDGHFTSDGEDCHRAYDNEPCDCIRCHSIVKNGQIQFLEDCTHKLAGQTLELPDWPL